VLRLARWGDSFLRADGDEGAARPLTREMAWNAR
jgi:hypothetical protein